MNYQETINYLFTQTPLFQNIGKDAYKEGLDNTLELDQHFMHPTQHYLTIHVAGTNGKGSCAHTIASILQEAGYKVGLYTSPHLVDFRERIRINGTPVTEKYVVDFVENEKAFFEPLHPSFFELTTAMAFKFFADSKVDVAVIEVGLGGRLDCTNIIRPVVSTITNISFDHVQFLGNTLEKIAGEKAGIIKDNTPVVIGETQTETAHVFKRIAQEHQSPIVFADQQNEVITAELDEDGYMQYTTRHFGEIKGALTGDCQLKNTATILATIRTLQESGKFHINETNVAEGFKKVTSNTGLMGRWQTICQHPLVICDTGHNTGGFKYLASQIERMKNHGTTRIIIGMVNDKDINGVLSMLPTYATYYFTQASVKRALTAEELAQKAAAHHLKGKVCGNVENAYHMALNDANEEDFIYVGGSSFVVADLLVSLQ